MLKLKEKHYKLSHIGIFIFKKVLRIFILEYFSIKISKKKNWQEITDNILTFKFNYRSIHFNTTYRWQHNIGSTECKLGMLYIYNIETTYTSII